MLRDGSFAPITMQAAAHCKRAYLQETLEKSNAYVTVLTGELSLNSVVNRDGIMSWRGSVWMDDTTGRRRKVMAVLHPALLFRDRRYRTAMKSDFARIARESRGEKMAVVYDDTFQQNVRAETFIETLQGLKQRRIVIDVETNYAKAVECVLKIIGVGWSKDCAMNVDYSACSSEERVAILAAISGYRGEIVTATPFDYAVLVRYGVTFDWTQCHDMTLLHSRFDIELPHTLEFIASMWTDRAYWKWMAETAPFYYNCLDCVGEWEAFTRLLTYCQQHDRRVLECYEKDRLLTKVCVEFQLNGLPFNQQSYDAEKAYYEFAREEMKNEVTASFSSSATPNPDEPLPRCAGHPRYTGRGPVLLRKGETCPCAACQVVRRDYVSRQPFNLRSRLQLASKLKEIGINVGKSMDKGSMAKLAKQYNEPRLMRYLAFKRVDTVVTRYFSDPKITKRTGRIHSNYTMHAAKHRWASSNPNAQQFMRPEE
jgi:hypothetical protein